MTEELKLDLQGIGNKPCFGDFIREKAKAVAQKIKQIWESNRSKDWSVENIQFPIHGMMFESGIERFYVRLMDANRVATQSLVLQHQITKICGIRKLIISLKRSRKNT